MKSEISKRVQIMLTEKEEIMTNRNNILAIIFIGITVLFSQTVVEGKWTVLREDDIIRGMAFKECYMMCIFLIK